MRYQISIFQIIKTTKEEMMKKTLLALAIAASFVATAQTTYDSSTLVDTNNTSISSSNVTSNNVSTSTSTNTNTSTVDSTSNNINTSTSVNTNNNINSGTQTLNNNNVNTGTMTYNNNNVNSGTMTYNNNNASTSASTNVNTNNNVNSGTMTYNNNNASTSTSANTTVNTNMNNNVNTGDMTNRNINTSMSASTNNNSNVSTSANVNQNIQSGDMTNRNINETTITQKVIQPPPTAVAPAMMSGGNADLCSTGTSGSVQTQIFGVSTGGTVRDMNCERLKLSKTLYDMGMKVAAVATMCQDRRVFDAMLAAGTPCPYEGQIGAQAKAAWDANPNKLPKLEEAKSDDTYKKLGLGALLGAFVFKLF
jgi:hypothetical protein